jgi:hypothetical protein
MFLTKLAQEPEPSLFITILQSSLLLHSKGKVQLNRMQKNWKETDMLRKS